MTLRKETLTEGMDLFLVMDESGSMYGEGGTDPQGLRYEAARYLVQNLLVKEADRTLPHRISIIHFGDTALSRPFVDLIPANADEIAKRIPHVGRHLGDTGFIAGLQEVKKVSDAALLYRNTRHPIIVI